MQSKIVALLAGALGRRESWRIGRALYLRARADHLGTDFRLNGEGMVLDAFLREAARRAEETTVLDVGANVGDWVHLLLETASRHSVLDRVRVHAFEPIPEAFAALSARFRDHRAMHNLRLNAVAASSSEGMVEVHYVGADTKTASVYRGDREVSRPPVTVPTVTLHSYCKEAGIGPVGYLKIDAEAHDMEVLAGAAELFETERVRACQFEYNHLWVYSRHFLKDAFDFVGRFPAYLLGRITPARIEILPAWNPEHERFFEGNYLILHQSAVPWLPVVFGDIDRFNTYAITGE